VFLVAVPFVDIYLKQISMTGGNTFCCNAIESFGFRKCRFDDNGGNTYKVIRKDATILKKVNVLDASAAFQRFRETHA